MADLLTTSQVQDLLQVDRTTIYRMIEDGRLSAIRVGKQWRFPKDDLERWLKMQAMPVASVAAPDPAPVKASGGAELGEILPMACTQLIQDAFADMLGVTLVIADMQGRPVTQISNPCGLITAVTEQSPNGLAACRRTWGQLAADLSLEPKFVPGELGLLCARGLIRQGSELKGMVVAGGIAPDAWPPAAEQIAAMAAELGVAADCLAANVDAAHRLDRAQRDKVLRHVQRMADVFSHMAEDRSLIYGRLQAIASLTAL